MGSLKRPSSPRLSGPRLKESDALEGLASELQVVYSRFAAQSVPKGPAAPPAARRG